MKQSKGFAVKGMKEIVCKIKKSLYGLKKSSRIWYKNINTYITELRLVISNVDHYDYFKKFGEHFIHVVFYVNDMLFVVNIIEVIKEVK